MVKISNAISDICEKDISIGGGMVIVAVIAAFCFIMWLLLHD